MKQSIHFIGIGGMGMGNLASLMLAKGYRISGSDIKENQLTQELKKNGARIYIGHRAANIDNPDWAVYSSAIADNNPEILEIKSRSIPLKKRGELLAELVNAQDGITVAGAHGKTTTTSMIANLLITAQLNPTTAIGGIVNGSAYHSRLGQGKYFVAELDESDGSFLFFKPFCSVITNIDFEHIDYYHNWENILKSYKQFIQQTKPKGIIWACGDDRRLTTILKEEKKVYWAYGLTKQNDLCASDIIYNGYQSSFRCSFQKKDLGLFHLSVPGEHNILNALGCIGVGIKLGIDLNVIQNSLKVYRGVERRFQVKARIRDILVIEDYGHHPTEIQATLKTSRLLNKKRIIAVFQPHRYSRTKYLMDEFVESLALCDHLILTDIYAASEKPLDNVNSQELYTRIKKKNTTPVEYFKKEAIAGHLISMSKSGDLIIFLGAGDINKIGQDFVTLLTKSAGLASTQH